MSYPEVRVLPDGGFAMAAPAKINLTLRVLGKRRDGYHELSTLFQEISWSDLLEFHPASNWSLEIVGAELDNGASNLITRAAQSLSQEAGVPCRARVVLHKEIPIGGGLGGGSSDAAITLLGLAKLWNLDWNIQQLHTLAADLGSDCAFFLYGGLARGSGRGERLELLEGCAEGELLLIVPPFGVSTAWAFDAGQFPLTDDEKSAILEFYPKDNSKPLSAPSAFFNDLENIVLKKYEELDWIKQRLLSLGAKVSMLSGSGSCMFGLFEERDRALHAAQQFGRPFHVRICRTIKRPRLSNSLNSGPGGSRSLP
jgi:4-diphosphocytidyl-2-C-methyl-D-erythritol kinase